MTSTIVLSPRLNNGFRYADADYCDGRDCIRVQS